MILLIVIRVVSLLHEDTNDGIIARCSVFCVALANGDEITAKGKILDCVVGRVYIIVMLMDL